MKGDAPGGATALRFQEACDWFVQLREQPESLELVAAWLRWCRSDPLNREAFEAARNLWLTCGLLPAREPARPLMVTRPAGMHSAPRMALAAAVVVAVATGAWLLGQHPIRAGGVEAATFSTARTEHRNVLLADGSSVEMAGDSRLTVRLGAQLRDIQLQQGEAYFRVAHDRARPFVVHAGALHVRAVGTRFDVRTSAERVIVEVEEGVVEVEPAPELAGAAVLTAKQELGPLRVRGGQEIAVAGPAQELQVLPIEPAAVASWREGRLRFVREPLHSVIASIRAASGREIELAAPELGELRFTGTLFSSHVEDWVQGLPAIFPVTVRQDGARTIIAPRDALRQPGTQ
jgi:transmembrane sensor